MPTNRDPNGSGSKEYDSWRAMKSRCYRVNDAQWPNYGGRGIAVCDKWKNDFRAFVHDVGPRPSRAHTIDRIDTDGDYEPGNCQWATKEQQGRNQRRNRMVAYRGRQMCLAEAVELAGVVYHQAASGRIRSGWSVERAVETPLASTNTKVPT